MNLPLLHIENLAVSFPTRNGVGRTQAVRDVTLSLHAGRTLAVVGESGSGKSVTALAVLRLLATPPAAVESGRVLWQGRDLLTLEDRAMRAVRGREIAMIFQEPMTSLNPVYNVGEQIVEAVRLHQRVTRDQAVEVARRAMEDVGIADPLDRLRAYPHQLSGGMRQRVMIAMALACEPKLLLADEPTTALDVTIQAQILELLRRLQRERGLSVMLITHDLGVVAENADEVAVMYAGRVVETADVKTLFARPLHPYTRGLLASMPRLGERVNRLPTVADAATLPDDLPPGVVVHPHGPPATYANPSLHLREIEPGHRVLCQA